MKKRIVFIIVSVLIGIICIEIYIRKNTPINYFEMDYEIIYDENEFNDMKLLDSNDLYTFYFKNYDENSYIEYSNGDRFSTIDAYKNGYMFLGDILKEIKIIREPNFVLEVNEKKTQKEEKKINIDNIDIYYYHIDGVKLINKDNTINDSLLELFSNRTITPGIFIDTLEGDNFLNKNISISNDYYILYKYDSYNILIKKDRTEIYIGTKDLKIKEK